MKRPPYRVLIVCTGNSARSILGECLVNRLGQDRFAGFSAGSQPTGQVNALALELLAREGYEVKRLRSKSWDEFAAPGAPAIDFVITVCDRAASETCPAWPGGPLAAHWGLPDPAAHRGDIHERRQAFAAVYESLQARVTALVELPIERLDDAELQARLNAIGELAVHPLPSAIKF